MWLQYDRVKAHANLQKHWVSFADAAGVFEDPLAVTVEHPDHQRWLVTLGLGSAVELLVVVWTEREDAYRIISARRATRKEREHYEG